MAISLVTRFTEGDCHILAIEIHKLTGWELCTFATDDYAADLHAFVRLPNGEFLDIEGVADRQTFCRRWDCHRIRVWESLQELSDYATDWVDEVTWKASPQIAKREAARLVCLASS